MSRPETDAPAFESSELAHLRELMVERHVAGRGIVDPRILQAMREVPRHVFVPPLVAAKAYGPSALPIGHDQTISQPWIVARMIELLDLDGTEKVLEVGTGTGYQAVVLSKVCARVYSIERINDLALQAVAIIRKLRIHNISVKVFDGSYGWSDQAPFDRIIVAAAAPEVPEPLVQQLARGGKLVLPVGPAG
ncbi:MAG: protein-L-isoaspartate(D-aspartate) O-methyltransferase, partial [Thermoanaerobaculia bacterium]